MFKCDFIYSWNFANQSQYILYNIYKNINNLAQIFTYRIVYEHSWLIRI